MENKKLSRHLSHRNKNSVYCSVILIFCKVPSKAQSTFKRRNMGHTFHILRLIWGQEIC